MNQVTYYGMGPCESYRDKHRTSFHSKFTDTVENLHEDYIRPQENGSHFDCDYVELYSDDNKLTVTSDKAFCFNASPYTQEELENKKHNFELESCGSTVLCIDYAQNGIGSNSCIAELSEKYRFTQKEFEFQVRLIPKKREK